MVIVKIWIISIAALIGALLLMAVFKWIRYKIACWKDYLNRLKCVELCIDTYYKVKSFSYLIGVSGEVGSYKTATVVGCTQYETMQYIEEVESKIQWVQKIVPYINYDYLFQFIDENYAKLRAPWKVYNACLQDRTINKWFHGIYDDYVNKTPLPKMLRTLIDARCALLRNQFVGSNITIRCPLTGSSSFRFGYEDLEIKREEKRKTYIFPKYMTIVQDEALLSIYKNTNSNSVIGDTGLDTVLRIYRHLTKETSRLYATAQVIERLAKLIRENSTDFIHMQGGEIIGLLKTKDQRLKAKEEKLDRKIVKRGLENLPHRLKNKRFRIYQERKKLYAGCYLATYGIHYTCLSDVGKKIESCEGFAEEVKFVFPLTFVFGQYDTHEFSFVDEVLEKLSNKTDLDLKVAKETLSELEKETLVNQLLKPINPEFEMKSKELKAKMQKMTVAEEAWVISRDENNR